METLLTRAERFPALEPVVGDRAHTGVDDLGLAGNGAVPGVDIKRQRLQILNQERLETRQGVGLLPEHGDRRRARLLGLDVGSDVAVQVIDECGVELALGLESGSDEPPNEAA